TDTTVSANTTYAYHVRAINGIGASDWSNLVTVTTAPPTAPSNLAATAVSDTQLTLTWTASSGTVSAYAIWRQAATGTWSPARSPYTTLSPSTDTTVSANATYAYHVRAINNIGASDWSNLVTVTMARPAAPSNLAATVVSATQLTLTW